MIEVSMRNWIISQVESVNKQINEVLGTQDQSCVSCGGTRLANFPLAVLLRLKVHLIFKKQNNTRQGSQTP